MATERPTLLITHGRGQAQTDPVAMKRDWTKALREGLTAVGLRDARTIEVDLAFYGDLWKPKAERGDRRRRPPSDLQAEVAREILLGTGARRERFSWRTLDQVIVTLEDHLHVGDPIIEFFLRDLDEYFDQRGLRDAADQRIVEKTREHPGPLVLLGHSMGSIVGYHALASARARIGGLFGLVTFGSPLGLDSIYRRMDALVPGTPVPDSIDGWQNVWNEKDFATVNHDLAARFKDGTGRKRLVDVQAIAGQPALNDPGRGHDPIAYLKSEALAKAVVTLVEGGPGPTRTGERGGPRRPRVLGAVPAERGARAKPPAERSARAKPPQHGVRAKPRDVGFGGGAAVDFGIPAAGADFEVAAEPAPRARRARRPVAKAARRGERRPSRAEAAAAASRPTTGEKTIEPTASADFPETVAPGAERTLEISLSVGKKPRFARASSLGPVRIPTETKFLELKVGVFAPAFEVMTPDGIARDWARIELPVADIAEASARFTLRARPTTRRIETTIQLTFYRGATPIGELTLATAVDPAQADRQPTGTLRLNLLDRAPDPDLTFVITDRSDSLVGAGPFDIRVSREGHYFEKPLGQFRVSVNAVVEAQGLLRRFHDAIDLEPRQRREMINRVGSHLWWLMPEEFQAFYRDEMHGRKLSIAIYSQEPYIPWELIVPQWKRGSRRYEDVLGIAFPIARWTQGLAFPSPVADARLAVIAPNYETDALPSAQDEAKSLERRFGAKRGPERRAGVRKLLASSDYEIVHFSGHGLFDPELVELSSIDVVDGSVTPEDLPAMRAKGDVRRAFVFFNACEVGELGFDLTALGGWAPEFCKRGFAGFVGPYWPVDDEIAGKAAETFYGALRRRRTVAEAVQAIRARYHEDPHPSWLAYTVHCQPNVKLGLRANA